MTWPVIQLWPVVDAPWITHALHCCVVDASWITYALHCCVVDAPWITYALICCVACLCLEVGTEVCSLFALLAHTKRWDICLGKLNKQ